MPHLHSLRVYYEDTDMAGIVYYANYLKFIERGRSEWVRDLGIDQTALKAQHGMVFAVRRLEADFRAPARFDDLLTVETDLAEVRGASFVMDQRVIRDGTMLFSARVQVVTMTTDGRPARLPAAIRQRMPEAVPGP